MKVRLSDEARADLRRIGDFTARDSPQRAQEFVRELRRRAMQLGENPLAFPLVPRHEHSGIRRRVFRNYLIFYLVKAARCTSSTFCMVRKTTRLCCFPPGNPSGLGETRRIGAGRPM